MNDIEFLMSESQSIFNMLDADEYPEAHNYLAHILSEDDEIEESPYEIASVLINCDKPQDFPDPFHVFTDMSLDSVEFEPITIFYGGNGTGKTTLLNIIAEQLGINRTTPFNRSNFYAAYLQYCKAYCNTDIPPESSIITSDDVFNYILDIRSLNDGIDNRREELFTEYQKYKKKSIGYRFKSLDDYDEFIKVQKARNNSRSKFVLKELGQNTKEYSNGENAFRYFTDKIKESALYLLDEPENSLSPARQIQLVKYLEEAVRFYNCQLIISTHSPFLLALPYARIYNLDKRPVSISKWTELENVKIYFDFFEQHRNEFIQGRDSNRKIYSAKGNNDETSIMAKT